MLCGLLLAAVGLVRPLEDAVRRIPVPVAQAMLAGVLFQLCLGPIAGLEANPLAVAPIVAAWVLALRVRPRWAAPVAFVAAAVVVAVDLAMSGTAIDPSALAPRVDLTVPSFTVAGAVGIALPLYLVTMAGQNVPGVAVMKGLGYEVPWRRSLLVTGVSTVLGAFQLTFLTVGIMAMLAAGIFLQLSPTDGIRAASPEQHIEH